MDKKKCSDNLETLTKEELIARIKTLQAHNTQLKNIIAKSNSTENDKNCKRDRKPFDFSKCKFRHVLLKFFYLGWDYKGFAVQEDTPNTIEHELFLALQKICLIKDRQSSNYHRCGRTDKGVSAYTQVISIDLRSESDCPTKEINYCARLNKVLPSNIQCVAWAPVEDNFSARFDCSGRKYNYFFPKADLNIEKMNEAAKLLIGSHDFRNFCKMDVGNGVVEYTRKIVEAYIKEIKIDEKNPSCSMYVCVIAGKAFLWHQIRCIMSILFLIGQGKEEPNLILELLDVEKNSRRPAYSLASEIPLNLFDAFYDIDWIYDSEAVALVLNTLWKEWTTTEIKATMIQTMLLDLQEKCPNDYTPTNSLIQGVESKNYIPVMKRKLCDSLEAKVENHKKRGKLLS